MSGKKHLNKNHPDCAEYTKKFNEIWDEYFTVEEQERLKYPDWKGKDHPADEVLRPLHKKCSEQTKKLQEQYSYLFVEGSCD